jgi:hypothetical protein
VVDAPVHGVALDHDHHVALGQQPLHDGAADAATASGDDVDSRAAAHVRPGEV